MVSELENELSALVDRLRLGGTQQQCAELRARIEAVREAIAHRERNFEATVERTIRELCGRFMVRGIYYDPYQTASVAQRLATAGLPMREYTQTTDHLTEMGSNLYELVKGANLVLYPDDAIKLAMNRAVAKETPRGWKITKEKQSHKIDIVIAMAMAAIAAVERGQNEPRLVTSERIGVHAGHAPALLARLVSAARLRTSHGRPSAVALAAAAVMDLLFGEASCPLYPQKQTWAETAVMSALCQKQTLCGTGTD